MSEARDSVIRIALFGALLFSPVAVPAALGQDGAETIEEVVVVGSRRAGRTATESPVPVDVVTGDDFQNQGTTDMDDMLRNLLPSYNVQRFPISDAATLTRPATLRGLPPDSTLLLVNAACMEALPLFLDRLLNPVGAILLSVTAILLFGEIIPQALCSR